MSLLSKPRQQLREDDIWESFRNGLGRNLLTSRAMSPLGFCGCYLSAQGNDDNTCRYMHSALLITSLHRAVPSHSLLRSSHILL